MKNIMKRIYRARFYKRVNFRNLDHVFRMKWSEKQIQFEKIKATPRYINNNNFFVKVKNAMIFVINKGNATSAEVYELICEVRKRVYENSGVTLEPEVIMLGKF